MNEDTLVMTFSDIAPRSGRSLNFLQDPALQRNGNVVPWRYLSIAPSDETPPSGQAARWDLEAVASLQKGQARRRGLNQLFFALTSPVNGEIDNFHRWYNDVHIPELLDRVSQFISARRYRLRSHDQTTPWTYLTLYAIASEEPAWMETRMPEIRDTLSPLESIADGHAAWLWNLMP